MRIWRILSFLSLLLIVGCFEEQKKMMTFGEDVEFLKKYTDVVVLGDSSAAGAVAVVPAYQGRVMTSSAAGECGLSFGWINKELIASGKVLPQINVYGGEDRFWMGPEGGQYAIFFDKGVEFDFENWQTPAVIDTEPFEMVSRTFDSATFSHKAKLKNWTGTQFDIQIDRVVRVLSREDAEGKLGVNLPDGVKLVVYESDNTLTNTGDAAWKKETGLLSIWILSMFNPSAETTIVIPFKAGSEQQLGPIVNDAYFGKVPADRLVVKEDVLFFSGDGQYRSKIGISPKRAEDVFGSYDAANKVLTLVQYTRGGGAADYVNSMWEYQSQPYAGDVVNSYNDGPPAPGKKALGPFYELETSSPAVELKAGESISHIHRVFHLVGTEGELDRIARATLKVSLDEIKKAF
jgi:hypothetical protein